MDGQCQCGQIKFKTPIAKPLGIYACHCWNCRHQSSSLFGMTASFPYFKIETQDNSFLSTYTRTNSKGKTVGYFCTNCGSRLLHEYLLENDTLGSTVSVKAGCLDGLTKEDYKKTIHIWTSRAVADIPADTEQYEEEPPE